MNALILAAGFGTRLRPLTETFPKAMVPVLGIPILLYHIIALLELGCQKIFINTHYLPDSIEALIMGLEVDNPPILVSEQPDILGTGGAIANIIPKLDDKPLLVCNADSIILRPWEDFIQAASNFQSGIRLEIFQRKPHQNLKSPVKVDQSGKVAHLRGQRDPHAGPTHYEGFFTGRTIIHPRIFEKFPPVASYDRLSEVDIPLLKETDGVRADIGNAPFYDTGNPSTYTFTNLQLLKQLPSDALISQVWEHSLAQPYRLQVEKRDLGAVAFPNGEISPPVGWQNCVLTAPQSLWPETGQLKNFLQVGNWSHQITDSEVVSL